jgi:hypothetical protein
MSASPAALWPLKISLWPRGRPVRGRLNCASSGRPGRRWACCRPCCRASPGRRDRAGLQDAHRRRIRCPLFLARGAVGVIVGAMGIANIMIISVRERRTEIGRRAALGARRRPVATQFVVESLLLCDSAPWQGSREASGTRVALHDTSTAMALVLSANEGPDRLRGLGRNVKRFDTARARYEPAGIGGGNLCPRGLALGQASASASSSRWR